MDIKNIALVRATNIIPFDGVVRSISEEKYLRKEKRTEFFEAMYDLLRRKGLLESRETVEQYMPYSSDYNSMVLWSLNGLVPDDGNNTFSNKTCAIIEGLAEQIEQAEIISLVPTDAAIKGHVNLSNKAKLLISKERYETLSQEEREKLEKLEIEITIFQGALKDAVDKKLISEGRYTAENLSLYREDKGYIKSETSDEVRETICKIAQEKEISQVLHSNVLTGQNDERDKLISVKEEFNNGVIVKEFFKRTFFEYLFSKMEIDENTKVYALYSPDNSSCMESLCDEIGRIGLDKYKDLVDEYNKGLDELRESGKLPTPQEIVNSSVENKKIDLISMLEEQNRGDTMLISAIKESEDKVKTSMLYEQMGNFRQLTKEKTKVSDKGAEMR